MDLPEATIESIIDAFVDIVCNKKICPQDYYDVLSDKTGYSKRMCQLALWQKIEKLDTKGVDKFSERFVAMHLAAYTKTH